MTQLSLVFIDILLIFYNNFLLQYILLFIKSFIIFIFFVLKKIFYFCLADKIFLFFKNILLGGKDKKIKIFDSNLKQVNEIQLNSIPLGIEEDEDGIF